MDYADKAFLALSGKISGVSLWPFTTVIGITVEITRARIGLVFFNL